MTRRLGTVVDDERLRDREEVFVDRAAAGEALAGLMADTRGSDTVVLAVPAGGVPVAAVLARMLGLALDVAVVSKITLPWNTEAGYGAVAFDGSVVLNEALIQRLALPQAVVDEGIARTRSKVEARLATLRGERPWPALAQRGAVLVDDGLASGFTMMAAAAAVERAGAGRLSVAVPTGHRAAVDRLAELVDEVVCANVRGDGPFAVASAYQRWRDVPEREAAALLATAQPATATA
jgi:predicted phosphoribosyltransferase